MKGQDVQPWKWTMGIMQMFTISSRQCYCVHKRNTIGLSSVPKVKSASGRMCQKYNCICAKSRIWRAGGCAKSWTWRAMSHRTFQYGIVQRNLHHFLSRTYLDRAHLCGASLRRETSWREYPGSCPWSGRRCHSPGRAPLPSVCFCPGPGPSRSGDRRVREKFFSFTSSQKA